MEFPSEKSMLKRPQPLILKRIDPLKKVESIQSPKTDIKLKSRLSIRFQDEIENNISSEITKVTLQTPISEYIKSVLNSSQSVISKTSISLSPNAKPSNQPRVKTPQEKIFRIPIAAIANQKNLRESTKTRLIDMMTETKNFPSLLFMQKQRPKSAPRRKSYQSEIYIPPFGNELDTVLKQIKEKERIIRQENEFSQKVRDMQMKIDQRIYTKEPSDSKQRRKTIKKYKKFPFELSDTGRLMNYKAIEIAPSRIRIESTLI